MYFFNPHLMKKFILLVTSFLIISCSTSEKNISSLNEDERWNHRDESTEIIRDDFGIPHIYGKTDADAVFGMLYAQCEDDFNRVERNYIWAIGRLAEVEGEKALYSDVRANLYMTQEEAILNYENSPKWLQELCIAFADGINFYLKNHPEVTPKLITHFEPWMPMYFSEGSIGGDIERVSTEKIRDFYGPQTNSKKLAISDGLIRLKDDEPRGSNGFAIGGKKTASGNAMLLINPHTSFFFRGESHVVSEEGLNAYGATTWGQFFIYQGFNEKTGWMHTSTGTDIIDEFKETIVKTNDKTHYKYGEKLIPIDSIQVSLNYATNTGISSKDFTLFRTHHGPITHSEGNHWISTALMWSPIKALKQSFTRTKKSNHNEFHEMMDIRTNSSNNTVYADADGTIAYYHGNFIPVRDEKFDYTKPVDGSNPATDWNGLHKLEENIFVKNPPTHWIQNCNSTPFSISRVVDAAGRLAKRRRRHLQPTYSSLPLRTDSEAGAGHLGFHADAHKPGAARRNWPTAAQGRASRQHRPRHHHQRARYFVCELTSRSSSMMGGPNKANSISDGQVKFYFIFIFSTVINF